MIEKLIEKYDHELNKIVILGGNHESDALNIQYDTYKEFIQDLEELKENINQTIMSNWDGGSYMSKMLTDKVSEVNLTKLLKDLGVDTDE